VRLTLAISLYAVLPACTVVPPPDGGSGPGKVPGENFSENICFQCSLRGCSVSSNACLYDTMCLDWLRCVSACPTDSSGVSAEGECLSPCGLPVSAQVLYGCIQDYSTGYLPGCEVACQPLPRPDTGG
jgi:hypothetical protein